MHKIYEYPKELRPRERLMRYGAKNLADHELLAILLRTGTQKDNVLSLSLKVLTHFQTLLDLAEASYEELIAIPGIGPAKALEIMAAIEFGGRVLKSNRLKEGKILSSQDIGEYLVQEMKHLPQENVVALYLNTKNDIIRKETLFVGSLNSSVAHPREIFKGAVRCSAARIILAHNHPSGNPEPSQADIDFTHRILRAGEMMGIELLDHIVVGEDEYISMREEGIILPGNI